MRYNIRNLDAKEKEEKLIEIFEYLYLYKTANYEFNNLD